MTDNFKKVLAELSSYKEHDRNKILAEAIQNRLNKSLETYYHELNSTVTNLSSKNSLRMCKEMSKYEQRFN